MLLEMLSSEERTMIQSWIDMYGIANRDYNVLDPMKQTSLDAILRAWDADKHDLFHLLGDNLIVEKPVEYERDAERIEEEIAKSLSTGKMHEFYQKLCDEYEKYHNFFSNHHSWFRRLFRPNYLRENRYSGGCISISCIPPDFRPNDPKLEIDVLPGTKIMKIFSKMAKFFDLQDEFEEFRIAHSQILNTKKTRGVLCLSIHPMDYLTMSDNSYDWDSCMSWENDGCYRQGTVEMMNSSYIVVAYLKGEKPFKVCGQEWAGNKKWRELYVVHPRLICNIKGYPYRSDVLTDMVLEWLRDLAIHNLDWNFEYGFQQFNYGDRFNYYNDKSYSLNLDFYKMYNDFDTANTRHMVAIREEECGDDVSNTLYYDLSGANICMCCGARWEPSEGREDMVFCWDCDPGPVCEGCGTHITDCDDMFYVQGTYLCRECYYDLAGWCAIDEERYYNDDLVSLYLTAVDDDVKYYDDLTSVLVHERYVRKNGLRGVALTEIDEVRQTEVDGRTIYYLNKSDCHRYALEDWFHMYSSTSYEIYRSRYNDNYLD